MAERQQSGEAEQQVEGAGEDREAERLHHEHRVDARERRDGEQRRHDRRADQDAAARRDGAYGKGGGRRHASARVRTARPA